MDQKNILTNVRVHIWVQGHVQGVGFRAHVEYAARQGPRMSRVDESRVEWEDVTGEFKEFGVKRGM